MDNLSIRLDDRAFGRQLSNLERVQLPFAAANALNDTAADALKHIQDRMDVVFDRPTRWTKNALMVWRAKKGNLEAQVKERPSVGSRHYLKVQEAGGVRPQTGVEKLLAGRVAYAGIIAAALPAAGAKLDSYGNWSGGERNQVLSALGAQRDRAANQTEASRKRAKGRASYFVPKHGLSPGVFKRTVTGELSKVLTFTTAMPRYDQRLGFYDGVQEVWSDKLPGHLNRRLAEAVASAR
ncbi:hypothetical protein [Pseudotabrizicola algicola]|uniref:Uncharacterized protein n=1 Tax=Pseudotabrizicola algicola TaxID=2709381 RepID=A0A6B3RLQ4_9RHOB|nr:hypothetical protein [Pseudotabrizicola algicola]NEX45195.1 hypothetical protein [Pseudotabrizicola algicola]